MITSKRFAMIGTITMVGVPLVAFTVVNSENQKNIKNNVKNLDQKTLTSK